MNTLISSLGISRPTSLSFEDVSNKEYAHKSSLDILLYFLKLLRDIESLIFVSVCLLPQHMKGSRRKKLSIPHWIS